MIFQTLYKKNSNGSIQQWTIAVEDCTIVTEYGQVDGKLQITEDTIKEGKNIGRANETTPHQQAMTEAKSQWEKKLKKGYVKSIDDAEDDKVDSIIKGGYSPMLAHKYAEHGDKIQFPAFLQPKLDGHRCTSDVTRKEASLWSRTRKQITSMVHIEKDLKDLCFNLDHETGVANRIKLDGELYNHAYHNRFEELTHFIRSPEPTPGCEVVQYHVYDVNIPDLCYRDRYNFLKELFELNVYPSLHLVETIEVRNEEEMMLAFEDFNSKGYEGAIVRNADGEYVGKRSYDLQKLKTFEDAEFKVVGVREGRGKLAGHAIFICETNGDPRMAKDETFDVKLKGETSALKGFFERPETAIDRYLTVKFQGVTNKKRVPRFPVGWRFAEKL